ncbi:MAG: anti-sigma factor [Chloroflexia bacterium]|nr:anti-sigma factor [Chloroflexia bacterium]
MAIAAEFIEETLTLYGQTLYQVALVAAGDERQASALLKTLIKDLLADPPDLPVDEAALLARLLIVADREQARQQKQRQLRLPVDLPPLYRSLLGHPLQPRMLLTLYLLRGYDGARLATVLGMEPAAVREALIAAARALGPAAGMSLPDRVSSELCAPVRVVLVDPSAGSRQTGAVRGHLATCAFCRTFDQTWGHLLPALEAALREALRDQMLPDALAHKLVQIATPPAQRYAFNWRVSRMALVPVSVFVLIAILVLPGFLRQPVQVVERTAREPVDAQALISRAIERYSTPQQQNGVWYARYETLWYFSDQLVAPMRAEMWLDPRLPARHRLQLSHRDGGAPYELQIGDGARRLSYAIDSAYVPSLYGSLVSGWNEEYPILLDQDVDAVGQVRARDERLLTGPWLIPLHYLRQAQTAPDLRLLGRQQDGGRMVQIVSFSGSSPLGVPPADDAESAHQVMILLAFDLQHGLLRSATELLGPAGGTQTSRVTWRLVDEGFILNAEQIRAAFAIERAWTGIGEFSEAPRFASADPALPLILERIVSDPDRMLTIATPPWLPTSPPAADRALLLWLTGTDLIDMPIALIYLGDTQRLMLLFGYDETPTGGEEVTVGPWQVTLQPGLTQRYRVALRRDPDPVSDAEATKAAIPPNLVDPTAFMLIEATGFTRAELLALITTLRPFDAEHLANQRHLFAGPDFGSPEAHGSGQATQLLRQP